MAVPVVSTVVVLDQAAVAVHPAWVAAVLVAVVAAAAVVEASAVAVVAVAVVVVAEVEAAAGGDIMNEGRKIMNANFEIPNRHKLLSAFTALALLCALVAAPLTIAQTKTAATPKDKAFPTAQAAADALVNAAENYDAAALKEILGPGSDDIVSTGEPARDSENSKAFAAQAHAKMRVDLNKTKTRATLVVGDEDWPFPVPIVKLGKSWHFDTKSGRQELLYRRIGRNELDAIQICHGYVEAQHEYALTKKENGHTQYAQRIISTEGQQDGLAWKNPDGTWGGPIGEKIAAAIVRGYSNRSEPYHGYFFKVLKGQGPAAPLGQLDYVIKGVMIGGFALVASPAQYRNTGVKSFMVSQDGVVYEKDMGPKSLEIFQSMDRFNPDLSWKPVKDSND